MNASPRSKIRLQNAITEYMQALMAHRESGSEADYKAMSKALVEMERIIDEDYK